MGRAPTVVVMLRMFMWLCFAISACVRADAAEYRPAKLHAFSEAEVQADASRRYTEIIANLAHHSQLDTDRPLLMRSKRIMTTLIPTAVTLKPAAAHWQWEIHVTSSPLFDGFSMAGGKVLLGSKFVHQLHLTDAELAMVIAHELAHCLADHQGEELSSARNLLPVKNPRRLDDVVAAMRFDYGLHIQLAALSRQQEFEADRLGLILAARAGWPTSSLVGFFQKLAASEDGASDDTTHPTALLRLRHARATADSLHQKSCDHPLVRRPPWMAGMPVTQQQLHVSLSNHFQSTSHLTVNILSMATQYPFNRAH